MRRISLITLGALTLIPFAFTQQRERSEAVEPAAQGTPQDVDKAAYNGRLVKLSMLGSISVYHKSNAEGEATRSDKVADFADLIVTGRSGEARYALLSRGGVGSIGDTLIPVPVQEISAVWKKNESKEKDPKILVYTQLSDERLSKAPKFEESTWREGGISWNRIASYYEPTGGNARDATSGDNEGRTRTASATEEPLFRLDELMGNDLFDVERQKIAKLENIILDPRSMKVAFVIVGSGGVLGIGDELRAIPFQALIHTRNTDGKVLCSTHLTKEQLEAAPKADPKLWETQGTIEFAAMVHREVTIEKKR